MQKDKTMRQIASLSLASAVAALAVSPVQAAEFARPAPVAQAPFASSPVLDPATETAEYRRGYRYRRYHRDRIDAGDVIAGALIIGGIFAVLSATDNDRDDRYNRNDRDDFGDNAFDAAIDSCVDRIDREQRVGSVDNVGRTRTGYSVSGTLASGSAFSCQVSGNGRVTDVNYGFGGVSYQSGGDTYGDPQYSEDTYARARANTYSAPDSNAQPAYPGGPIDGDQQYADDYSGGEPYGDAGEPY